MVESAVTRATSSSIDTVSSAPPTPNSSVESASTSQSITDVLLASTVKGVPSTSNAESEDADSDAQMAMDNGTQTTMLSLSFQSSNDESFDMDSLEEDSKKDTENDKNREGAEAVEGETISTEKSQPMGQEAPNS